MTTSKFPTIVASLVGAPLLPAVGRSGAFDVSIGREDEKSKARSTTPLLPKEGRNGAPSSFSLLAGMFLTLKLYFTRGTARSPG